MFRELAVKYDVNKIGKPGKPKYCYLDVYEDLFAPLKEKELRILEIGVSSGGSVKMWEEYFPKAQIVGFDRQEKCKGFETDRIKIITGDQGDDNAIAAIPGEFDIIIDDGSHKVKHQRHTLRILWPMVKPGGYFIIEDLQTSYVDKYGGGMERDGSMIEHLKKIVDDINWEWWTKEPSNDMQKHLYMMLFFSGLCVLKKNA